MKRIISLILCLTLILSISAISSSVLAKPKKSTAVTVSASQRKRFFKESAFIGSSIGIGQKFYFDRKGKELIGNPTMLVRGSYSFYNDKKKLSKWMITYKGTPMQAKTAIKKSKVKRVFIAMGTNDFLGNADVVYRDYVEYLEGIRKVNPKVVIFIESTTGVTASRQGTYLNSKNIARLNKLIEKYCKKQKDMYFIDVSSKLLDKNGHLMKKYASDNYVHLTDSAYELWTKELIKFTDKYMISQSKAEKAVKAAEKKRTAEALDNAKELVKTLDNSTFKDNLSKRIKKIKIKTVTTTTVTEATTAQAEITNP